jgi:hypothetical protein
MLPRANKATVLLVGILALSGATARTADRQPGPVSQVQLDQALARKLGDEGAARDSIRQLLQRDDVRKLAHGYGLDVRRAEAAVGTLHGEELRRLASQAAAANSQLAGGDELEIRVSLVALLLIVIIVILLSQG